MCPTSQLALPLARRFPSGAKADISTTSASSGTLIASGAAHASTRCTGAPFCERARGHPHARALWASCCKRRPPKLKAQRQKAAGQFLKRISQASHVEKHLRLASRRGVNWPSPARPGRGEERPQSLRGCDAGRERNGSDRRGGRSGGTPRRRCRGAKGRGAASARRVSSPRARARELPRRRLSGATGGPSPLATTGASQRPAKCSSSMVPTLASRRAGARSSGSRKIWLLSCR